MSTNVDTVSLSRLRGTDSNSLLRLYDKVRGIVERSQSRQEREMAEGRPTHCRRVKQTGRALMKRAVWLLLFRPD
jgi:hypothetical protein